MKQKTDKPFDTALIYRFLRTLRKHNNREWFNAHKAEYLEVKAQADALTEALIALVAEVDHRAAGLTPAECTYRIYRDTRFSNDKTPYKTHIGIFVNPPTGKKGETLGYYFHLEPDATMFIMGTAWLPSDKLKAIRQSIYDEIDEYREIVESPDFKRFFPTVGFDPLKTAPKGFDKNWPYIDYVRPRVYGGEMKVEDDFYDADGLAERLRPILKQAWLYNRFVNFVFEED